MMPGLADGSPFETLSLTALRRDKPLFPVLLDEARQLYAEAETAGTVIHTAMGTSWERFGPPRRKRDLGSVVLDNGVAERIELDLKAFMCRAKWYAERGQVYPALGNVDPLAEPHFIHAQAFHIVGDTFFTVLQVAGSLLSSRLLPPASITTSLSSTSRNAA